MVNVVILHAYSAKNLGDGLLVELAVDAVHKALGSDAKLTMVARQPQSFDLFPGTILHSLPAARGAKDLPRLVRAIRNADLVIGVGGGYARGHSFAQTLKFLVAHGYQLVLASHVAKKSIYLPQSIGPFNKFVQRVVRRLYGGLDRVYARDNKTYSELSANNVQRIPDSAVLFMNRTARLGFDGSRLVLSARPTTPDGDARVRALAAKIQDFDGYVQSTTLGNNDSGFVASLEPRHVMSTSELLSGESSRVVIAVRLHAALMAIEAGHYVIHLSYERKGFGAFEDLNMSEYCFNVNNFDVDEVLGLAAKLSHDHEARREYDRKLGLSAVSRHDAQDRLIRDLSNALS